MSAAPHAITSLRLENFRNYRSLAITLPAQPAVLRGANGMGKTNILEAISLLAPGRGLRGAKLREMDRIGPDGNAWVVAADVAMREETNFIGTGRDGESTAEKRIIKVNGERVKSHAALTNYAAIQWLTPSMDQVFSEGSTVRRKFFDRIVYSFVPEHAARVVAFESAMRERNRLLVDRIRPADPYWLSVLEQQMAEHGVAITLARQEVLARLQKELTEDIAHFPRANLRLMGMLEGWLDEGDSALDVEGRFAERLMLVRGADAVRGRSSIGPQRSLWEVIHSQKQMPAENCSTGEQKALLLSILLAAARARKAWCGVAPILLLDEVIAHLDVDKRACLFDLIRHTQIQAWMTGTDAADFRGLEGYSTQLEIDGGMVKI